MKKLVLELQSLIKRQDEQINIQAEQIEILKRENVKLRENNAVLSELNREFLQRNSKNSSLPPSSDRKPNKKDTYNRGGAKMGHEANIRKLIGLDRVDATYSHSSENCPNCGSIDLAEQKSSAPFQFIELMSGRCTVMQHERKRYRCCNCQNRFASPLPDGIGPSNFGSKLQASIAMMTGYFHLSKRQVVEFLDQFFDVQMSNGTVCKIERRVTSALAPAYEKIKNEVQQENSSKFVDETGWRDQNRNGFVWVAASRAFSFFHITYHRNRESRDELLGKKFSSPIITDRYSAYGNLEVPHQFCLAHLKRDFKKFSEMSGNSRWISQGILRELNEVFKIWKQFQGNSLDRDKLKQRTNYRRQQIKNLMEIGGSGPKGKFQRFCQKLLEHYDKLWTYLRVPDMEPTNNIAERSLRPIVLLRKKSLGTKSKDGMVFVATITTVCQTLRKQSRKIINFITCAMNGMDPAII